MWRYLLIDVALGALVVAIWYWTCVQLNRRKCVRILGWIEHAFGARTHTSSVHWMSPSRFRVQLRLANSGFVHSTLAVQLHKNELPFRWVINQFGRKRQETLTFESDLHCPPSFNFSVQNHRWCGKSRRGLSPDLRRWTTDRLSPIIITTRADWQPDVSNMMASMVVSRDCNFLNVTFRRTTPHFTATLPLESIVPEKNPDVVVLDALRELASGATSRL